MKPLQNNQQGVGEGIGSLSPDAVRQYMATEAKRSVQRPHSEILDYIVSKLEPINFYAEVLGLDQDEDELPEELEINVGKTRKQARKNKPDTELKLKHFLVITIEHILKAANELNLGICINNDSFYLFNGAYWKIVGTECLQTFLGQAAEKLGNEKFNARYFKFQENLVKQFKATAYQQKPEPELGVVMINLLNGTFVFREEGSPRQVMREHRREDFLTYQLPFAFDPDADAPVFRAFLNEVQPDKSCQLLLSEYLGYVFTHNLKLEKAMLLYGTGANGKSVFFEVTNALLGPENVSSYQLQSLTKIDSYERASLADKLVNYASEMSGGLETSIFKQMTSGEPLPVRQIYGTPFIMTHYAKLLFNCNVLPKEVELTNAFFRRFLIVPFSVTIPEEKQDPTLARRIIESELAGVFNWVLAGLQRLIAQGKFTESEAVKKEVEKYKKESDNVMLFLEEEAYEKSIDDYIPLKELYANYSTFCQDNGYRAASNKTLADRLEKAGYELTKKNIGKVVFVLQKNSF